MNIKELFLSDLDLSDVDGWSDDYIAKINYNFTVIKNGRKKGPQGLQGPVGLDGSQGGQGLEGATGPTGAAGNQGPDGSLVWKRNINEYDTNDTIHTFHKVIVYQRVMIIRTLELRFLH